MRPLANEHNNAVSPIISKVFEHCILDRFGSFFDTADNQFGFKKVRCTFAIRVVRNIVENFAKGGSRHTSPQTDRAPRYVS